MNGGAHGRSHFLTRNYEVIKLEGGDTQWVILTPFLGHTDTYRASRDILSDILEGHFVLYTLPPPGSVGESKKVDPSKKTTHEQKQSSSEDEETEESDSAPVPSNPYALLLGNDSSDSEDEST